jgi:hypothetical protein
MVDLNNLNGALSTGANAGFTIFIVAAAVLILCVIGVIIYLMYNAGRKYKEFLCVIYDKDGFGNRIISYDNAGIFIDKQTNNKRFFLKKHNVGLSPDNVPAIYDGKNKVVFLQKVGLKNFRFVKISFDEDLPTLEVTEEDVNWAINSYERQKKFNNAWLEKYLPYIALIIVAMVIMIVFIYFFKDFDTLKTMADKLYMTSMNQLEIQNRTLNYLASQNANFVPSGTVIP